MAAQNREIRGTESRLEAVLDFCVGLGKEMIASGANLERVSLAVERVCNTYRLTDVSINLLSTSISMSARDAKGSYAARQASIPPAAIHLTRLKQLNRASYKAALEKPSPSGLSAILSEAIAVRKAPDWVILAARVCAMACLCLIFGGGWREVLPVAIVTVLMHYTMALLARPSLNRIVTSAVTMFIATAAALLLMSLGLSRNGTVILITVSMLVLPGIPLVNAARNLLCGNEMNGILQMLKATIETAALAMGIYLAIILLNPSFPTGGVVTDALSDPVLLVLISFFASVCFGVVFHVEGKDLWLAGIGGALSRIALLLLTPVLSSRMAYMTFAALIAAIYSEILATSRKDPSTYFIYPAIIPLIPGDLFYYCLEGLYAGEWELFRDNGFNCLLALAGMSIGFVLSSIIAHYTRKLRFRRQTEKRILGGNLYRKSK